MTYINAFHSPHGIVMSADTQETVADEINYREKIEIGRWPLLEVAIGGAGHGDLVDGFIKFLCGRFKRLRTITADRIEDSLDAALQYFYKNDVRLCRDNEKTISFLIAVRLVDAKEAVLWATKGMRAVRIKKFQPVTIGYEAPFCKYVARRFFNPDLTLAQLVLLSAYIVAVAMTATANSGLDTSIVIIRNNGTWEEEGKYIQGMEPALESYEKHVTNIFLACADMSISLHNLKEQLVTFGNMVLALHREQIDKYLRGMTLQQMSQVDGPYSKTPLGTHVVFGADGKLQHVEHDPKNIPGLDEYARKANEYFNSVGLIEYVIRRESGDKYSILLSGRWSGKPHELVWQLTKDQLIVALSESKPFKPEDMLAYLQIEGSEFFVYAPMLTPPRSNPQKSKDQP